MDKQTKNMCNSITVAYSFNVGYHNELWIN